MKRQNFAFVMLPVLHYSISILMRFLEEFQVLIQDIKLQEQWLSLYAIYACNTTFYKLQFSSQPSSSSII